MVDSEGAFSQQIDVVIFDRQYTPFIAHFEGQKVIPAESVYGVFEAKQLINAGARRLRSDEGGLCSSLTTHEPAGPNECGRDASKGSAPGPRRAPHLREHMASAHGCAARGEVASRPE